MVFIVLISILALLIVLTAVAATVSDVSFAIPAVLVVIALVVTVFSSATTVSARSVGIQTAFGKYQKTLDNGLHWTNPAASVEEFSTQVQTLKLNGGDDDNEKPSIAMKYNDGGEGVVQATVNWQISDKRAKELWERYRSFERVRDDLVDAKLRARLNEVIGKRTSVEAINGAQRSPMGSEAKTLLSQDTSPYGVEILDVTVTDVAVDDRTKANIQSVIAANQGIEKAKAEQKRAIVEAETAKIRQNSGSLSPAANQRYCLEVVNNWDKEKNGPIGNSFNCDFNGSSQKPVLVTPTN